MERIDLSRFLRKAATNLEDSLRHFEDGPGGLAQEFVELKLQASIFQYDVCLEMASFVRNKPTGFATRLALKGLVLRLYEYDDLMNTHVIPKLLELARKRDVPFDKASVKAARDTWKTELKRLRKWSDVRNQAAGHYGRDLHSQIRLLKQLEPDEVMEVARAFFSFNMALLVGLRDAGRGVMSDA
jgi:hypothetical protein